MKMELSNAILLGDVLIERRDAGSYCGCAIGMAVASLNGEKVKGEYNALDMAHKEWPFLEAKIYPPAHLFNRNVGFLWGLQPELKAPVEKIISCAFGAVVENQMSLESLVDMVREIESQFEQPLTEQPATADLELVTVH